MGRNLLDETLDVDSAVANLVRAIDALSKDSTLRLQAPASTLRGSGEPLSNSGALHGHARTRLHKSSTEGAGHEVPYETSFLRRVSGELLAGLFVVICIFVVMLLLG